MGMTIDEDIINDFKSKIKDYGKDYAFSQEEVLNILERYEIKHAKSTIEAIPKDQYEARLKADMVAMLEDLRLDFQEAELAGVFDNKELIFADEADYLIQQKINALKGEPYDKRTAQTAD